MKRPSTISVALLLTGAALASCSSPSKAEELYGLTDEELLGVYLENALYYVELNDWDRVIDQATLRHGRRVESSGQCWRRSPCKIRGP